MVQGGRCLGLALETAKGLGIFGDFVGQEFQGNETVQPGVFRLVDDTHPSTTNFFNHAVMRYGSSDHAEGSVPGPTMLWAESQQVNA
jgi:hypothetical protein